MRKLFIVLLAVLLAGTAFAGTKVLRGDASAPGKMLLESVAATTYYVRTTGNDSNNCLTTGAACLTIQEAVDRIPDVIKHAVTVDVGSGNFDGFRIFSKILAVGGSIVLSGTLGAPTPATGTASGTSTGGTTLYMDDSGQSWTVDDLAGHYLVVGSDSRIIRSNTATRIEVIRPFSATTSAKAYTLEEPKTVLNDAGSFVPHIDVNGFVPAGGSWTVENFSVTDPDWFGVRVRNVDWGTMQRIRVDLSGTGTTGVLLSNVTGEPSFLQMEVDDGTGSGFIATASILGIVEAYLHDTGGSGMDITYDASKIGTLYLASEDNGSHGLAASYCEYINGDYLYLDSNTGSGAVMQHVGWFDWGNGTGSSNGGSGLVVDVATQNQHGGTIANVGTVVMSSNSASAIILNNRSSVYLGTVTGTGNTGYGVELTCDSTLKIKTGTAVTGTTADATDDEGATTLSWTTDFASDGDTTSNANFGTRVRRKD